MSQLTSISDYYLQDLPEGTLFMPHDVTCVEDSPDVPQELVNRTKWTFHEKAGGYGRNIVSKGHNYISFLGKGLKGLIYEMPDKKLMEHWGKTYGEEFIPEFVSWGTQGCTVVKMPVESIPAHNHSVDPDVQYKIQSKKFIGEVDVPQARILDEFKSPCVVKATNGLGADRVYFCHTKEEYGEAMEDLNLPRGEYVITELIKDVVMTYCCHFYITKGGEVQWISAAEQYLLGERDHGYYESIIKVDESNTTWKELMYPACIAVGKASHKKGYFGYCGADIVVDKKNQIFVVDINPRVCTGSTMQLSSVYMYQKKGYTIGSYRISLVFKNTTIEQLIKKLEDVEDGVAVLFYALKEENGLRCGIRVHTRSVEMCDAIFDSILRD